MSDKQPFTRPATGLDLLGALIWAPLALAAGFAILDGIGAERWLAEHIGVFVAIAADAYEARRES